MSHFTVLVVGDNVEDQLAPFEESPSNPDYLEFEDHTDEWKEDWKTGKNREGVPFKKAYKSFGDFAEDHHGGKEENGRWGWVHNQNAKWDWYTVGGRWSDFFILKQNNRKKTGDVVRKSDVDFDKMRSNAEKEAKELFDKYLKATKDIKPPEPWDKFRGKYLDIQQARTAWHNHPWKKALSEAGIELWFEDVHEYFFVGDDNAESKFISRARDKAFSTYAVLYNGEWMQKGEMGWFGMSHSEMSEDEWLNKFNNFIDSLPDDTQLTLVDCHI